METLKEFSDKVINVLRMNSKDRFIPRRLIIKIAKDKMRFLLSQKLHDRTLYREENVFTDIPCIEMEKIDNFSCPIVEFRTCRNIMRSKKKLPELIFSRYGDSIRLVTNLDFTIKIDRTNPVKYINDRNRYGYKEKPEYYTRDGYLYIINSNIELVNLQLITLERDKAEEVSCDGSDECISPLDFEFVGSDKLREAVYREVLQELAGLTLQILPDENPNLNQKSI